MDFSSRFSLVDFLAYLFPGVLSGLGIFAILKIPFFNIPDVPISSEVVAISMLFVIGYILGVVLSGFSETLLREWRRTRRGVFSKDLIPLPGLEAEVRRAFQDLFGHHQEAGFSWSSTHYYLCRALVYKFMPENVQTIERQIALRQLRMNLVPTVFIWALVGLFWGLALGLGNSPTAGLALVLLTLVLAPLVVLTLLNRMDSNERRETREVLADFLAGFQTGLFSQTTRHVK